MKKKSATSNLYFIAIIPPNDCYDEARKLKHYFKQHYNSKASLNSPPHITLHMPFQWKKEKEVELIQKLHHFSMGIKSFDLQLSNFGSFPPRVIFIHVLPNDVLCEFINPYIDLPNVNLTFSMLTIKTSHFIHTLH